MSVYPSLDTRHALILDSLIEVNETLDAVYDDLANWGCLSKTVLKAELNWLRIHGLVRIESGQYFITEKGKKRRQK